jgi:Domain of unknown function (DUF4129)
MAGNADMESRVPGPWHGPAPRPGGIFLLVALLLGVAAALLTGAPPTPKTPPSQNGAFVSYSDLQIFGYLVIGLLVAWVAYRILQRLRDPSSSGLGRLGAVFVVAFALCLVFLVAAHLIVHPVSAGTTPPSTVQNMTGPPPAGNGTPGSTSNVTVGSTQFPGWALYVGILVVGAFLAIVAVPAVYGLLRRPPPPPDRGAAGAAHEAIAAAIARLDADPTVDPRELIIALYGQLLQRVGPRIEDLDSRTAREVERAAVTQLRLPAAAARDLTSLFEEARYSPHALGPRDSERARAALGRILDSLGADAEPGSP